MLTCVGHKSISHETFNTSFLDLNLTSFGQWEAGIKGSGQSEARAVWALVHTLLAWEQIVSGIMIRAATGRIEEREGGISYRSQEKLCLMPSQGSDYSYTRRGHHQLLSWENLDIATAKHTICFKVLKEGHETYIIISVIFSWNWFIYFGSNKRTEQNPRGDNVGVCVFISASGILCILARRGLEKVLKGFRES